MSAPSLTRNDQVEKNRWEREGDKAPLKQVFREQKKEEKNLLQLQINTHHNRPLTVFSSALQLNSALIASGHATHTTIFKLQCSFKLFRGGGGDDNDDALVVVAEWGQHKKKKNCQEEQK